jgi:hypothetical protein
MTRVRVILYVLPRPQERLFFVDEMLTDHILARQALIARDVTLGFPDYMAADSTFPLYPVFSIASAALMLLVFMTSIIRQSWNLGVAFLCFWLFWGNLTAGINTIIWANNADIKLYVYCDIGELQHLYTYFLTDQTICSVTHVQIFLSTVKPACTLIITRRLYKIASLRSVDATTRKEVGVQG